MRVGSGVLTASRPQNTEPFGYPPSAGTRCQLHGIERESRSKKMKPAIMRG